MSRFLGLFMNIETIPFIVIVQIIQWIEDAKHPFMAHQRTLALSPEPYPRA